MCVCERERDTERGREREREREREGERSTFTQIPHPMQSSSEMKAIFDAAVTSIHSFPALEK